MSTTVVASYDFKPHAEGYLAFKKGDHITVTERSDKSECEWPAPPSTPTTFHVLTPRRRPELRRASRSPRVRVAASMLALRIDP